jgi:acyl dehydratase
MTERYLEDFAVGQTFGSGRLKVDKERIKSFAAEFDPQPFHLDEEAARATIFQGLAASGWHTAALTMRLLVESDLKPARASTNCVGPRRYGPATSCISRAKCWRSGRRNRVRVKG